MKLVLLLFYVLLNSDTDTGKCKDIRTGKFTNEKRNGTIVRTKNHQTEIFKEHGINFQWKVRWANDCQYIMILEKNNSTNSFKLYSIGDTIDVKIIKVYKDKYDWEATYKGRVFTGFNYILK